MLPTYLVIGAIETEARQLADDARSSVPASSVGVDPQQVVEVTIDATSLPTAFRIRPDWSRYVPPEALAAAALSAYQAARIASLSTEGEALQRTGWFQRLGSLVDDGQAPSSSSAGGRTYGANSVPVRSGGIAGHADTMRRINELVSDTLSLAADQRATRTTGSSVPPAVSSDDAGRVTLTAQPGALVGCTIDARWAASCTTAQLMNALGQALLTVRRELERRPAARNSTLVSPARATLNSVLEVLTQLGNTRA